MVTAVLVSSVIFAHFHGEALTGLQYLHFTLAGILLAIPYVITGSLALSIGMHWTFNVGRRGCSTSRAACRRSSGWTSPGLPPGSVRPR